VNKDHIAIFELRGHGRSLFFVGGFPDKDIILAHPLIQNDPPFMDAIRKLDDHNWRGEPSKGYTQGKFIITIHHGVEGKGFIRAKHLQKAS